MDYELAGTKTADFASWGTVGFVREGEDRTFLVRRFGFDIVVEVSCFLEAVLAVGKAAELAEAHLLRVLELKTA